jgi:hypothetical protein
MQQLKVWSSHTLYWHILLLFHVYTYGIVSFYY